MRGRGNVIAFVFNDELPILNFKQLTKKAHQLEQHYFLDFSLFLKDLRTHNSKNFGKF